MRTARHTVPMGRRRVQAARRKVQAALRTVALGVAGVGRAGRAGRAGLAGLAAARRRVSLVEACCRSRSREAGVGIQTFLILFSCRIGLEDEKMF